MSESHAFILHPSEAVGLPPLLYLAKHLTTVARAVYLPERGAGRTHIREAARRGAARAPRPRDGQPALHTRDDGARLFVHGGAGLGAGRNRRHGTVRRARRLAAKSFRRVGRGLDGRGRDLRGRGGVEEVTASPTLTQIN